jgi:phosphatidate cytidylyltransferase
MSVRLLIVLAAYFLFGAFLLALTARVKDTRLERWTKYFVYLGIVSAVLALDWLEIFSWASIVLAAIGLAEIVFVWLRSERRVPVLVRALLIYGLIAFCFVRFTFEFSSAFLYSLIVIFDGMAQLTGQLFEGRKISPRISPNKTVSGLLGGFLALFFTITIMAGGTSVETSAEWAMNTLIWNLALALLYSLGLSGIAFSGDLLASKYKRVCGVKDYGSWIPGHGGLLDRFDSFMFTAAVLYVLSEALNWVVTHLIY